MCKGPVKPQRSARVLRGCERVSPGPCNSGCVKTSRGLWRACALVLLLMGVQRAHPLHAQRTHTAQPGESERARAPTCCPTKPAILRRDSMVHHTSRGLWRACALVLLLMGVQRAHPLHAQRTHTAQPGESERAWAPTCWPPNLSPTKPAILRRYFMV